CGGRCVLSTQRYDANLLRCFGPTRATTAGRSARNNSTSVFVLIGAPDLDSGLLAVSAMESSRTPDARSEWSTVCAPETAASTSRPVRCFQPVVSGTDC